MELNLALNTIVYIMIFIFPGIIFRKFYFIRHNTKQFDQGNLFERFAITIFLSIAMLMLFTLIFFGIKNIFKVELIDSISYGTFKEMFESLAKNQLPPKETIDKDFLEYSKLILGIYFLSGFMGGVFHFISNIKFVRNLRILNASNYWYELLDKDSKHKKEKGDHALKYILCDALTQNSEGTKLYSGEVVDYFISRQSGELQTLVLKNVNRYKKNIGTSKSSITTSIPGHVFILDHKTILNLNLRYIYEKEKSNKWNKILKSFVTYIYLASILIILFSPFTVSLNDYTGGFIKSIILVFYSFLILTLIFHVLIELIDRKKIDFKIMFLLFLTLIIPILWTVNYIPSFWWVLGLELITPIIFGVFQHILFGAPEDKKDDSK